MSNTVRRRWNALASASLALLLILGVALGIASCAQDRSGGDGDPQSVTKLASPDNVISEELMLPLRQALNLHHIADVHLQMGNVSEAASAVRQILSLRFPVDAPESEDVQLDARARLAKLLITLGKLNDAMKVLDAGVANAKRRSFFLSNVYSVKGQLHEAIAVTLDESDKAAANEHRAQAIRMHQTSIEIDEVLLEKLTGAAP